MDIVILAMDSSSNPNDELGDLLRIYSPSIILSALPKTLGTVVKQQEDTPDDKKNDISVHQTPTNSGKPAGKLKLSYLMWIIINFNIAFTTLKYIIFSIVDFQQISSEKTVRRKLFPHAPESKVYLYICWGNLVVSNPV